MSTNLLFISDDEVIEWNGRSLQGATLDEVYEVILESKQEPQVELIVQRRYDPYVLRVILSCHA